MEEKNREGQTIESGVYDEYDPSVLPARIAGTVRHSSVDGPGVRFVVFFQGCPHHCPQCHNPETWDPEGGEAVTAQELAEELSGTRFLDGLTLSGGDPFLQPRAGMFLADAAHRMGLNVWAYTGWTWEALLSGAAGEDAGEMLWHIDVLVDGPFVKELQSRDCIYRGSSNQRLIDVPASLACGKVVLDPDN
ncbi:MAG: anaerobic ribonucleoside-triphosphate reductase activating protein [Eubacteriales bacterium]|nr:anaerobic ribonucleoside-triphosphate reductase activating protein [Eubacteriales bacterium]